MSDHVEPPPPEPFNPGGHRQPFWALTNPLALGVAGTALLLLGLVFVQQAWIGFSPDPVGNAVAALLGVALGAIGVFAVYLAWRRARWYRALAEWELRTGQSRADRGINRSGP